MSLFLKPRVKETTTTEGTGTLQLLGAPEGYQTFLAAFGNGNRCYYTIIDGVSAAYEYGLGTINSSSQLARTLVINGSAGDEPVLWGAGTKIVYCAIPPECCANNGVVQVANDATTFSVLNGRVFLFDNSGTPTVTAFEDGIDGQDIQLINIGANTTTIQAGSAIKTSGGGNFSCGTHDTIRFVHYGGTWYELARSNNS